MRRKFPLLIHSPKNSQLATTLQRTRPGGFSEFSKSLQRKGMLEPRARVELATCRLRIGCSTTELPRPGGETYISIRGKLLSILQERRVLRWPARSAHSQRL